MAQIGISVQATLLDTANYFVLTLADASAPNTILETVAPNKPYGNPFQVIFTYNCIAGKVYRIKLWENTTQTAGGVVRDSMDVNATASSLITRFTEHLKTDTTPGLVSGTTQYVDTSWSGWDVSLLFRNPNIMVPETEDPVDNDHRYLTGGGFELTRAGDEFQPDERFTVVFAPQIIPSQPGTPSSGFGTGRIITTSETLTNADANQSLLIEGVGSNLSITLPALSGVTEFTDVFYFTSCGGFHINASFICAGTDKIRLKTDKSSVHIGQAESIKLWKQSGKWRIDGDLSGIRDVGQLVFSAGDHINTIACAGQSLDRADYPRLWEWLQSGSGIIVPETNWQNDTITHTNGETVFTKRGFFSSGNGSTTFRMPILFEMIRGISQSETPGALELDQVGPHNHKSLVKENGAGQSVGTPWSYPSTANNQNVNKGEMNMTAQLNPNDTISTATENKIRSIGQFIRIKI